MAILKNSFTFSLPSWTYVLNASKAAYIQLDHIVSAAIKSLKEAAVKN